MTEGRFSEQTPALAPLPNTGEAGHDLGARPAGTVTFDNGQAAIGYALFVPENYSPRYAYPLLVWFHDDGLDEHDVMHWLPRISPQNYLGIGLRAPIPDGLPGRVRWSTGTEHMHWLDDDVAVALGEVCGRVSVHPGRIVTAGIGQGGTMALQMLLRRPEWFAGAAALNAALPADWRLDGWGQYAGRRLWLGHSELLGSPAGLRCIRPERCTPPASRSLPGFTLLMNGRRRPSGGNSTGG